MNDVTCCLCLELLEDGDVGLILPGGVCHAACYHKRGDLGEHAPIPVQVRYHGVTIHKKQGLVHIETPFGSIDMTLQRWHAQEFAHTPDDEVPNTFP